MPGSWVRVPPLLFQQQVNEKARTCDPVTGYAVGAPFWSRLTTTRFHVGVCAMEGTLAVRRSFCSPPTLLVLDGRFLGEVSISASRNERAIDVQRQLRAFMTELSLQVVNGRPRSHPAYRPVVTSV